MSENIDKISKSENDWKKDLTPEQYAVLREKGTEPAFTGKYVDNHEDGVYAAQLVVSSCLTLALVGQALLIL